MASGLLFLQTTPVQTYIAGRIADMLAENTIDARISFSKIHIKPFSTLVIRDLTVTDPHPCTEGDGEPVDTLFTSEYIAARFTLKGLTGKSIRIGSAFIQNARLNLVLEDGDNSTNLTRMFRIPEGRNRQVPYEEIFNINDIEVDGIRFTMKNRTAGRSPIRPGGIDWNDLDVQDIKIKGYDLRLTGKVMSGTLERMSFREKSGYSVRSISGRTRSGQGIALIEGLKITDSWSNIDIPYFSMVYDSAKDFADFIDKVRLEAVVRPSRASMKTISYFAPGLKTGDTVFDLSGELFGTVSSFSLRNLDFGTGDNSISGRLSGNIAGLPDPEKMTAAIDVHGLSFNCPELEDFIGEWTGKEIPVMDRIAPGSRLRLDGKLYGNIGDLALNGEIGSPSGRINADLSITGLDRRTRDKTITGTVGTTDLDLRMLMDKIPVRECTLEARLKAVIGPEGKTSSLTIDTLKINRLNLNGYDYGGIAATGTLSDHQFNGKVICNDPNLNFMFQGIFSFSGKTSNSLYRFYANIGYADLYALNIDRRGKSRISLQTSANFTRTSKGDMLGNVDLAGIELENAHSRYSIGDIRISSFTGNGRYRVRMASGFAEGSYSGSAPLTDFIRDISGITIKKELPALSERQEYDWSGENYEISFRTFDTMDLLSFVAPGLYIADGTSIRAKVDTTGLFSGRISSQRIAFNEQYIKDMDFEVSNADNSLSGELTSESIYVATVMMKNNSLKIFANDNHVGLEFSYDNQDIMENRGEFVAVGDIGRNDRGVTYDIELLPSSVYLNSREWNIYPSEIFINGKDISVKRLEFRSGEQSIVASGGLSGDSRDTLSVNMDRFDISILNPLIGKHFDIQGTASGLARVTSPAQDRGLLLDFTCNSTGIGGEPLGDITVKSGWDSIRRRFEIMAANSLDGKQSLSVAGSYTPSSEELDMKATLDMLSLSYAGPFLKDIFSGTGGYVSGEITATGPVSGMTVRSKDARLTDARLRVAYTNVEYTASGPFHVDGTGIYLDGISIKDRHGNTGKISGGITYDHFKDMRFDIGIDAEQIEAINLDDAGNPFYGHLFATGRVDVTGPANAITLSAEASTAGSGDLHIPVSSTLTAGSTNLLKFKEPEVEEVIDPYEQMMSRLQRQKEMSRDFAMKLKVSATPEVEAFVEIDKASGNVLNGRGTGTVELSIHPSDKTFNILGDYTINSGNYHFVALGIAARDFSINDGSSIRFNGDIMESTLNIGATYRTKASLSTLIADTTSVNNRRTVECGIRITEKLSNPRLAFSIDVPDLDPTVKARVESALSTEDKVQKQFLALLISNSFIPDEQSGITNNSSVLFSNVTDIMTNQLNNIFQKLNIPLDLGLSYQQNNRGNDVFDVAVSTQLFNNRVIVNGNIGNRDHGTGNSNSDVVGDIDIEIKLDRPGAFRLNLFSHSADQYTNYLDNSQRNGIGITYQKEFNHFGQFVKSLFQSRRKKEEAELEETRKSLNEEKVYIRIEK